MTSDDPRLLSDAEEYVAETERFPGETQTSPRNLVRRLLDHIAALTEERDKLRAFARKILGDRTDGHDVDGSDLQDWAVEAGVLIPVRVTEQCGEECNCAAVSDFPQTCYRLSASMLAVSGESQGT